MKVLFLTPHPEEGASTRYRVKQFFPYLESNGIECIFRPFLSPLFFRVVYKNGGVLKKSFNLLKGIFNRTRDFVSSAGIDVVFVHLEAAPLGLPVFENLFALCKKPIIYDLDDAIFIKEANTVNRLACFFKSASKIPRIISKSGQVIVCNEYLENYAKRFNRNVTMIPTSVDTDKFTVKDYALQKQKIVIGWIGSHSTACYLTQLAKVFPELAKKYEFTLKVIGSNRKDIFPGINAVYNNWSLENDICEFQSLDIGIYPLPDNEWVKGKTGFKTVQYMSVGVPCVASRVGRNISIITSGVNGYLASTQMEWIEKLSLLIENADLRKSIGLAGRKTVEERFSLKVNAPKYLEVIRKACNKR